MSFCGVSGSLQQVPALFSTSTAASGDNASSSAAAAAALAVDLSLEKDVSCTTTCNGDSVDLITVQSLPMLVSLPSDSRADQVGCGSRHTVVLTKNYQLWAFGWNKYGQLGIGHNHSRDTPEKMSLPRSVASGKRIKMLRCGDWGTAIVVSNGNR